jgi:hypothetical protein
MQIDQAKIEKAIIDGAVSGFIDDGDLYERVKKGIEARIDNLFATKVAQSVTETVERIAKEGFERQYRKTDSFGRPVGEPTSISKELEAMIGNYWNHRVNLRGEPVENGAYNSTSRAEWMMAKVCADDFSKEMKQHVVNVAGALKDHFRGVLNDHVATMLTDVFKVQSEGDRALKNKGMASIAPPAGPIGTPA